MILLQIATDPPLFKFKYLKFGLNIAVLRFSDFPNNFVN